MSVTVYLARAMTGIPKDQLVAQASHDVRLLQSLSIDCLDPVFGEGVIPSAEPLQPISEESLNNLWREDKKAIRKANVVIDLSGPIKSEGAMHEIGVARYFLWKPVVRVLPGLGVSVARLEDDAVVNTLEEAAQVISVRWGTWGKRFRWRVKMLCRSFPKFLLYQFMEFF